MDKNIRTICRVRDKCSCIDEMGVINSRIFIELTSKCNFKCEFCPNIFSEREKTFIDINFLEKILNDLKEVGPIEYVMFSQSGEPFLHPKFSEACDMVKRYGYKLYVTTNGSLLRNEIKNLPIDQLFISLETTTKKSFKIRNVGMVFENYLNNICDFAKNANFPITIYIFKENRFVFPDYEDLINTKNDEKSIRMIENVGKKINPDFKVQLNADKSIPDWICIAPKLYFFLKTLWPWQHLSLYPEHLSLKEATTIDNCSLYKHNISILNTGEVSFCCGDYDGELSIGNVKNESLKNILLRKERNVDLAKFHLCRRCRGALIPK